MKPPIIFDLDGTLADTAPLWRAAEDALFAYLGHPWNEEFYRQYVGMNAPDLAVVVHRLVESDLPVEECQTKARDALVEAYRSHPVTAIPGAVDLVRRLSAGHRLAVASGSPQEGIDLAVSQLGIADCFELTLSSETVANGKPAPDVFIAAAASLGVAPGACTVFEDTLVGAQAARAAGMACIVRPAQHHNEIRALDCRVVERWDEVDLRD